MNTVIIFTKVFPREFYRLNAGFFLLVIGITCGTLRDVEHIALASFFISSPVFLLIPIVLWMAYVLKVVFFNRYILIKSENEWCFNFFLLPTINKTLILITVTFLQMVPVTLYGLFLLSMSVKYNAVVSTASIVSSILLLHMVAALSLQYELSNPNREVRLSFLRKWLNLHIPSPYPLMVIEWILRSEPISIFGTKLVSIPVLLGILHLYSTDNYDFRLIMAGVTFVASANVILIYHIHRFENLHLPLTRNLPLQFKKRLMYIMTCFAILWLPEAGLSIRHWPEDLYLTSLLMAIGYGLSILIVFYGLLFIRSRTPGELVRYCFYSTILLFMLVLAGIPPAAMMIVNLASGLWFWQRNYYTFEYQDRIT